jgi:proteic killer suppression protein
VTLHSSQRNPANRVTIQSWKGQQAQAVFLGKDPGKGFPADLIKAARRRLQRLDAAATVEDLRVPPSHRLHPLEGDRAGEWSVSVNDQFRITFKWGAAGPEDIWFGDYH